jgi:hypothetical protein
MTYLTEISIYLKLYFAVNLIQNKLTIHLD